MERTIEEAEHCVAACHEAANDPAIVSDAEALRARYAALEAAQTEVDRLYARWAELEAKRGQTMTAGPPNG